MPGLVGAAILLAILAFVWRYSSPSSARTALTVMALGAFIYLVGDGLSRAAAAGGDAPAARAWNTVRFLGIAFVPAALAHFAATYPVTREANWIRLTLVVAYAAGGAFAALRLGSSLLVTSTVVERGTVHVEVGPAFALFAAYGLALSLLAFYFFAQTYRTSPSKVERLNSLKGYAATLLPFGGSIVYFSLFRVASSPVFDPIVPLLTVSVALYASAVFSHDIPASSLSAIRTIFAAMPDGLLIANRKGLVTFANPAAESFFGTARQAAEGRPIGELFEKMPLPEPTRKALASAWNEVSAGGRERALVPIVATEPAMRAHMAFIASTESSEGKRGARGFSPLAATDRYVFLFLHDETDSKGKELMLSRTNEVKDLFISMIGHDLKAPLNAITGYSELIGLDAQAAPNAVAVYRYAHQIIDSARQIQLMMENARVFSRLADPHEIMNAREAVDLALVVEKEISNLRSAAERRRITVKLVREGLAGPAEAFAAPILRSAFQNLIDNAIKYSPERSAVVVTVRAGADAVEVDVQDDGPGIPADKREAIFRKFTRLEQTRTRTEGLGLGLSISRQIVELHNGTLQATARPDGARGTLFRVRVPRGAPPAR